MRPSENLLLAPIRYKIPRFCNPTQDTPCNRSNIAA